MVDDYMRFMWIDSSRLAVLLSFLMFLSGCSVIPTAIFKTEDSKTDISQLTEAQQKHYELSLHYIESQHYDVAESKLDTIIAEYPNFPDAYNALGVVYERRGRVTPALAAFLKAVSINPQYDTAVENYGNLKCYISGGDGIEYDAKMEKDDRVKSRLHMAAARCYIKQSDFDKARLSVQTAIEKDDQYAMSYFELARIEQHAGDAGAANKALNQFHDLNGYTKASAELGLIVNKQLSNQPEIEKYQYVLSTQFKNRALQ